VLHGRSELALNDVFAGVEREHGWNHLARVLLTCARLSPVGSCAGCLTEFRIRVRRVSSLNANLSLALPRSFSAAL